MSGPKPRISVVCPVFNEERVVPLFHAALCEELDKLDRDYDFEIVYVDDGSKDGSLDALRGLAAADPKVRWLSFSRNFGHQAALTAGLERATGDAVITMDSDLQHPPQLIGQLLDEWSRGHDVVLTIRAEDRTLGPLKRWTSNGFYRVVNLLSEVRVPFAAADFRLLARPVVDALLQMDERHRFLRGMVAWLGFKTAEVPYVPNRRVGGTSQYSFRKMLRLASDGIFAFSLAPLRWLTAAGFGVMGLGTIVAGVLVALTLAGANLGPGLLSALLVTMLILGGAILAGLGLVGEYVGRTFEQVKGRPVYVLRASSDAVASASRGRHAA